MEAEGIEPYEEKTGLGLVRHILIRESHANGSVLVCLVINGQSLPQSQRLVDSLRELPEITGICLNVNTARNNVILGQELIPLWGESCIYDKIGDRTFRISPLSFFQINPIQTEKLYAEVARMADLSGNETVLDLFCGAGTIGLYLADKVRELYGVEIVPEAIEDARVNAALNDIENARFSAGASEDIFKDLPSADLVILDPPRKGCEASLIKELAERGQERIIYVSCNPATLARDLKLFSELGYEVKDLRCVDMFPQTMHVETVCLLSKLHEAKHHINVKVDMDELDLTSSEAKATYKEIEEWVQDKYGFHVTNLNIAQVKQKHGIIERENYNKAKSVDSKQPGCPEEKVKAIEDAMRNFQMI